MIKHDAEDGEPKVKRYDQKALMLKSRFQIPGKQNILKLEFFIES